MDSRCGWRFTSACRHLATYSAKAILFESLSRSVAFPRPRVPARPLGWISGGSAPRSVLRGVLLGVDADANGSWRDEPRSYGRRRHHHCHGKTMEAGPVPRTRSRRRFDCCRVCFVVPFDLSARVVSQFSRPSKRILFSSVLYDTPSCSAARVLFHFADFNASSILNRSTWLTARAPTSCSVPPQSKLWPSIPPGISPSGGRGAGSWSSAASIVSESERMAARSIVFCNSRTFPGQG